MPKSTKLNKNKRKKNNNGVFADIKLWEVPGFKPIIKLKGYFPSPGDVLKLLNRKIG